MNPEYRFESKYIINPQTASVISRRLQMCCRFDDHSDKDGFYKVTSLYFDDYLNSSLNDNLISQKDRKKYRIRIYDGKDQYIRLEKKIKRNQLGKKESCQISKKQYQMILEGRYEALKHESETAFLKNFCMEAMNRQLKPKVIVEYDRQSFVYDYGDVRITLDHRIRYGINGTDLLKSGQIFAPAAESEQIVMEVKYTGFLPSHIKALVQQGVSGRQSVSKYTLCRASMY